MGMVDGVDGDFAVAAFGSDTDEMRQDCADRGIPFLELGAARTVISMSNSIRRAIKSIKPDVVEAHTVKPSVAVALLATTMPVRPGLLAVRHHNLNHHLQANRTAQWADRFVNSRADGVVAVSYAVRGTCIAEGLDPDRCHVALNGLDLEHLVSRSSAGIDFRRRAQYLLLAVGRIDWQKDYPTMLRSLAHLVSRGVDAELAILGSGLPGYESEMINLSDQLALKERVHWMGWQSNVPAWMHSADLFVHSAVDEAHPLILIEVLASGLPIVATAVGGSREVVQPFYEPVQSGDPVAFADEIENNLQNLSERRIYAASICDRAIRRFAPRPMAEAHLAACHAVLLTRSP
jgi:glycosyltransferase involved in cell wall biosynthesis